MIVKEDKVRKIRKENVSVLRDMSVAYNSEEFYIAINKEESEQYEYVCAIQADKLKEVITLLFGAGVDYQENKGIDIGFGIGDVCDESIDG